MTKLQQLITNSMESGKSYRRIGEECNINHVSIARYHKGESTPNGKNLAILEKYYRMPLEDLVEPVKRSRDDADGADIVDTSSLNAGQREAWHLLTTLPPEKLSSVCHLLKALMSTV